MDTSVKHSMDHCKRGVIKTNGGVAKNPNIPNSLLIIKKGGWTGIGALSLSKLLTADSVGIG